MKTNGNKIRELRLAKPLTQEELAQQAGLTENSLSTRTVQRAENENNAGISAIRKIARVLGVQPEELLEKTTQQTLPTEPEGAFEFVSVDKDAEEFLLYLLEKEELQRAKNQNYKGHVWFVNDDIKADLEWGVGRINDVVELAEQNGWVLLSDETSGSKFNFRMGQLTGTGKIFADPNRRGDPKLLLRFLASQGEGEERGYQKLSVPEISDGLSWDWMRTEDALEVLEAQDQITAIAVIGFPSYSNIRLTAQGRRDSRQ